MRALVWGWRIIPLAVVAILSFALTDASPASARHAGHPQSQEAWEDAAARAVQLTPNGGDAAGYIGTWEPPDLCVFPNNGWNKDHPDYDYDTCIAPDVQSDRSFAIETVPGGVYTVWIESWGDAPGNYSVDTNLGTLRTLSSGEVIWYDLSPSVVEGSHGRFVNEEINSLQFVRFFDWDSQPDRRSPPDQMSSDAEPNFNRWVFAFHEDRARTWVLKMWGWGDRYRVWVQASNVPELEDDLTVRERFTYPPPADLVLEQGATIYREFLVTDQGGLKPSTGVTANLSPAGSCAMPEAGRLRCSIPTAALSAGLQTFTFSNAIHGDHPESTVNWPGFGFTLAEREVTTKAQVIADASAKIDFAAFVEGATDAGLSVEFHTDDSLTVESSRSIGFDVGVTAGAGGGVKLGPVSPRAKAEIEVAGGVQAFESQTIDIADPTATDQSLALASFVLDASLENLETAVPGMTLQLELIQSGLSLRERYEPFITSDQFGVAASIKAQGQLGVFTTNRRGLAPLSYGLGAAGNASISVAWQLDTATGEHAIIARSSHSAFGVVDPLGWDLHFAGDVIDFTGSAGGTLEATFTFSGTPDINRLTSVAFKVTAGTTAAEHITGDSATLTFSGPALRAAGGTVSSGLSALLDPLSGPEFTVERLQQLLTAALQQVEGELTVTETQGTGFAPSLAIGGDITVGGKVGGEAQVGGDWRLTVTETTQRWLLGKDEAGIIALFQVSDFPYVPTAASTDTATQIVSDMFTNAVSDALEGSLVGNWIAGQVIAAGFEGAFDGSNERTGTATLWVDGVERTIRDEVGTALTQIEFGIRLWGSEYLPDFIVSGQGQLVTANGPSSDTTAATRTITAQSSDFFASEFLDIAPYGITVDPAVQLSLSYLASPADPQALRIYRYEGNGVWLPLPTTIDAATKVATAEVSVFGTFVVGLDETAPTIVTGEPLAGFAALITDVGSGIDASSVALTVDGGAVASNFDSSSGVVTPAQSISTGATVVVTASDMAGNVSTATAVIAGGTAISLVSGFSSLVNGDSGATTPQAIISQLTDPAAVESVLAMRNGVWLSFGPDRPSFANTLLTIDPWMPMLLRMTASTIWAGDVAVPAARTEPLGVGFTFVTYTGSDLSGANDVMNQFGNSGAVDALFRFDQSTQSWQTFRPTSPAFANSLKSINQFDAILVLTTQATNWSIPAP
jgi:hypothetical protein